MPRWDINFNYRFDITNEMLECLVKAEAHRIITARIPLPPRVAREVNTINIVRQIKGTTGLEGNPLTEQEIEKIVDSVDNKTNIKGEKSVYDIEIQNAYEVQNFIMKIAKNHEEYPYIDEDLIKRLHLLNTKDIQSTTNTPGEYRNCSVTAGDYMPPAPNDIPMLMTRFVEIINDPQLINGYGAIYRAIVAHFYLITIHPFGDGNGRTSRALEAYILYHSRFNARGFYSLANYFYRNRERYIQELQDARFKYNGNLNSFAQFALKGFVEEITEVQERVLKFVRRITFLSYVDNLYSANEINARCAALMQLFSDYANGFTIQQVKDRKNPIIRGIYENIKTDKTIVRDINHLKEKELITIGPNGAIKANMEIMEQFEG